MLEKVRFSIRQQHYHGLANQCKLFKKLCNAENTLRRTGCGKGTYITFGEFQDKENNHSPVKESASVEDH